MSLKEILKLLFWAGLVVVVLVLLRTKRDGVPLSVVLVGAALTVIGVIVVITRRHKKDK